MDRSHLLARQFGGESIPENIVPLTPNANQNLMAAVERDVGALLATGQRVYYVAAPVYGQVQPYIPVGVNITYGSATTGLNTEFIPNQ